MTATVNRLQEEIVFDDLAPTEIKCTLAGKSYVLREASGAAAVKWRNAMTKGLKMADGKLVGIEGVGDLDPLLVSLCLFEVKEDGRLAPVSRTTIEGWKNSVVQDLAAKARKISDLGETTDNPQRTALIKALSRSDAPVKLADFRSWLRSLCEKDTQLAKDFEPIMLLVAEEAEDRAKNSLSATTDTSV